VKYVTLGRSGIRASRISFGAIKLPEVSQEQATAALNLALDLGVNFIDTARNYRDSERKIGVAVGHRRDEFSIATKSSGRSAQDAWRDLETSRRELNMDHIDVWQLHSVSSMNEWRQVTAPGGALAAAKRALAQGIIGHIGITIHRDLQVMREAILSGEFETIMLCHNVLDPENVAREILPLAKEHDVGTIIMKPLNGGSLTASAGHGEDHDPIVRGSLRALLGDGNVDIVIPGMRSEREVRENAATADLPPLSEEEKENLLLRLGQLQANHRYGQRCLRCGYCLDACPEEIPIPDVFRAMDMYRSYPEHLKHQAIELYEALPVRADSCIGCASCTEKCPAALPIPEMMEEIAATFARVHG